VEPDGGSIVTVVSVDITIQQPQHFGLPASLLVKDLLDEFPHLRCW
jgi:hypothetical protein